MAKKAAKKSNTTLEEATKQIKDLYGEGAKAVRSKWAALPLAQRELAKRAGAAAGGLALVLTIVAAIGIYAFSWQNSFTGAVSRVIPFPAAYVNGRAVSFNNYQA